MTVKPKSSLIFSEHLFPGFIILAINAVLAKFKVVHYGHHIVQHVHRCEMPLLRRGARQGGVGNTRPKRGMPTLHFISLQ